MTTKSSNHKGARDPDLIGAEAAIKRAARKARENARKSGTAVVYMENGKIREERPDDAHPKH